MATFRVGQKVKIVIAVPGPFDDMRGANQEGVVTGGLQEVKPYFGFYYAVSTKIDEFFVRSDCLVPLYDGHEKTSWDAMKDIWTPHHDTISA